MTTGQLSTHVKYDVGARGSQYRRLLRVSYESPKLHLLCWYVSLREASCSQSSTGGWHQSRQVKIKWYSSQSMLYLLGGPNLCKGKNELYLIERWRRVFGRSKMLSCIMYWRLRAWHGPRLTVRSQFSRGKYTSNLPTLSNRCRLLVSVKPAGSPGVIENGSELKYIHYTIFFDNALHYQRRFFAEMGLCRVPIEVSRN